MITEFIKRFDKKRNEIRRVFAAGQIKDYQTLIHTVIKAISEDEKDHATPDPERIHCVDDGDYQGTLVFVIAEKGYQPSDFWYVKVSYGSCSGCDTLQAINEYMDGPPDEKQIADYMTLALHVVQGLKKMGDENV